MDFRDSLFDSIYSLMQSDPAVMVVNNDMSAMRLDAIREKWPERVLNIGIAEQNMMSVMGGLARCGKNRFWFRYWRASRYPRLGTNQAGYLCPEFAGGDCRRWWGVGLW